MSLYFLTNESKSEFELKLTICFRRLTYVIKYSDKK
ncbi:hypothetical protein BH23BAC3_BH23BAC3_15540 [soil metagenome]